MILIIHNKIIIHYYGPYSVEEDAVDSIEECATSEEARNMLDMYDLLENEDIDDFVDHFFKDLESPWTLHNNTGPSIINISSGNFEYYLHGIKINAINNEHFRRLVKLQIFW